MLRNVSIAYRFVMGFGTVTLIVVLLGCMALWEMKEMRAASSEVDSDWLPGISAVAEVDHAFMAVRFGAANLAAADGRSALDYELKRLESFKEELKAAEAVYVKMVKLPEERQLFQAYQAGVARYVELIGRVASLMAADRQKEANDLRNGEMRDLAMSVAKNLTALVEFYKEGAKKATLASGTAYSIGVSVVGFGVAAAAVLTLVLANLLIRSIVAPLKEAVKVAERVSAGDLTQRIVVHEKDEPAQLLLALQAMQQSLRDILQRIQDSANRLASASVQLTRTAESTNNNLNRQTSEVEQAVTAVNELTTAVAEVASNAVSTSEASQQSDRTAHSGRNQVIQAVSSIDALAQGVTHTVDQIGHLATNVQAISKVLDVIRSIADQTNLLALNAAIEAARAGDAGRGFAVVADEVRALAHRTQQSTQEIEQMIGTIQSGTDQAVLAMKQSNEQAITTLEVAQKAGQALDEIAQAIGQINERNLLIASASEEQAQVTREVDQNLVSIRDLSVQSLTGATQTMQACKELSQLAANLNSMIGQFRI